MGAGEHLLHTGMTLREVCRAAEMSDAAVALLANGAQPPAFVDQLTAEGLLIDAVRVLAHALEPRPGVWWAWFCARHAHGDAPSPEVAAALDTIKQWIGEPTDANRRAAMARGEAVGFGTPAGCAALAAFLSGGSLGPPDAPPAPPPRFAAAKAIAGTVQLAAVLSEPEKAEEKLREYLAQGLEAARKTNLWTPQAQPASGERR